MPQALTSAQKRFSWPSLPSETRNRYGGSARSRAICKPWRTGWSDVRCGRWPWSQRACTGFPCSSLLEERGFEVYLVNARYLKNVPRRKIDASDCQWIQYLHSVGLLRGSSRPPAEICALRTLWRHRASLLQMAAEHILH